ncbi:catalase [Bradyrhizobium sp. JR3.5]
MAKTTKPTRELRGTATIHDQKLERGEGGELHQIASGKVPMLTTAQGGPVSDDQNSLKIGPRGPTLPEDFHFREKIFHFDHERIPERVVHARGYAAHGFFENYKPLSKYTRADLFQRTGEKTPAFVRFSTVAGSKGSFDLARDVRGFAVKLYTQEGNWDIVGNNIPVFFIQDAIKFPDMVHAVKEEPDCAFPQAQSAHDNFWDFIGLTPESMHMIMWVMSDRAIPRSFRFMEGFGVHTFRFVNAKNESTFVKFHWKPKLGMQSVEAVKINGADPDFHRRDLWTAIKTGNFPEWELQLQLFDQDFADSFDFDVLDPTKLIPEEVLPPIPAGRLVLNRMPDNFFAETEQVAFMTQNVPPGSNSRTIRCCKDATSRTSTPSSSGSEVQTSRRSRSMRPNARSLIFSRTATWPCAIQSGAPTTSRIPSARAPESRHSAASRHSPTWSKAPNVVCAPRASQTIIARRVSSLSVKPWESRRTSLPL